MRASSPTGRQWAAIFSDIYGPVDFERFDRDTADDRFVDVRLWRLRLCRIELGAHRLSLPPALARPGMHPFNHVRLQTKGSAFFEQDDQIIELEPGDCLAYNVARPHAVWSTGRSVHMAVVIPIDLVKLQSVPVELLWMRHIAARDVDDAGGLVHAIVERLLDHPPTLPQGAAAGVAEALIGLLKSMFSRDIMGPERFSRAAMTRWRAKAYIDNHLRDADLTVEQIAAAAGCSTRYLHAIFSNEDATVARYMWRSRVERCHQELISPASDARSILDVAFAWGFSSASHFTRAFRARYGYPPSQARLRRMAEEK